MGFLEDRDLSDLPSIPEYYKGKTLFITGGTGFMGECLIEKLLYSCSDLEKIYLLIRPKRGVSVANRVLALYEDSCFERLHKERPGLFESKVVGIAGDASSKDLGISTEDRETLINNVDIIFNSAASVKFDDPLPVAADLNMKSTIAVIELARQVKNLSAFIHISTCYTNTNYGYFIEEKLYPAHADWRDVLEICDNTDLDTLNAFHHKVLGDLPNTYVFTKQLAEHIVNEEKGRLPAVIIRPSVVISAHEEPDKGWVTNFNGPVGLQVGSGKGVITVLFGDPDVKTDYIPVDICIKHFITAAWIRGTKKLEPTDDIPIYNCSNNNAKYVGYSLNTIATEGLNLARRFPLPGGIKYPELIITSSPIMFHVLFWLLQLTLAAFYDSILWIVGRKPMLIRLQRKIYKAQIAVYYYMKSEWTFDNTNFIKLRSCIKDKDRVQFYYPLNLYLKSYYLNSVIGANKYLFKGNVNDYAESRKHLFRVWLVQRILQILFIGAIVWVFMKSKCYQHLLEKFA